jgi:hypothetical protein
MKKKRDILFLVLLCLVILAGLILRSVHRYVPGIYEQVDSIPAIFPDYANITVPVNIAPLNFNLPENLKKNIVVFTDAQGKRFIIKTRHSEIRIPPGKWKKMLQRSANKSFEVKILSKNHNNTWTKYKSYKNLVVTDKIDNYIAYRQINTGYILWEKMGIYLRSLENFKTYPILTNEKTNHNCINCHTFCQADPARMVMHLRRPPSGTLVVTDNKIKFINTGTKYTMSQGVYPSWHPDGKIIAFSVNIIKQNFHAYGHENIYVFDKASDIILYDVDKNMITTCPAISTKRLENFPVWSSDGNYLYYISGPEYNADRPDSTVKYDLLRIAYNISDGSWGQVDTLLTARETGKSITYPDPSPDGKYIVFSMGNYGYFNAYSRSSDIYIMNLENKEYKKLPVNSDHVESYHSWSSSGRWFLFVSKRIDGLYSNVYFSYFDTAGNMTKPFLLPQKNPEFYEIYTYNFNRPVFIKDKFKINADKLVKVAFSDKINTTFDPDVDIDGLSGATRIERDSTKEHTN